jgi:ABC-type transport system involved in cytochrome c biogenesis permease subunit
MKKFTKYYLVAYAMISVIVLLIGAILNRRVAANIHIGTLLIGSIMMSLLVAWAKTIFDKTWGNGMTNIMVGYIIIFPIPFILRRMFIGFLFRAALTIYIVGFLLAFIYGLVIVYASIRNKKEESNLNELLKKIENNQQD